MKVRVQVTVRGDDGYETRASVVVDEAGAYRGSRDPIIGAVNAGMDGARKLVAEALAPRGRSRS